LNKLKAPKIQKIMSGKVLNAIRIKESEGKIRQKATENINSPSPNNRKDFKIK